ncbi:5-oxoprolinase subunit PxpB [Schnuerera sp. xch1]|uniref:5-oxoprolinase subunit PxpB n=1 Tax=Schnuerera sp. xch1 TaxID=2874283 RepID=UPI001CC1643B|nr:5-oxoprolinase subunit PxpB [Schnuerera sp. xch1]MBZ2175917.1 5-oxoprolinase subunit PxpB [Schnuerera sp. xch1]
MYDKVKYLPAGDKALIIEFGNEISIEINAKIRNVVKFINEAKIEGIEEIVPTYRSIQLLYNPLKISYSKLIEKVDILYNKPIENKEDNIRIFKIPTLYGNEYGPDINYVAEHNHLTLEEVIKIHTRTDYLVYMLGFTPGFTYLGGMSERIATPRLSSPRTKIPAGSVGIAGSQTGMYPSETPGGWQLIGRTPLRLYAPNREPPVFLNAGDYVRFVSITEEEYKDIQKQVEEDNYKVKVITPERGEHDD